MDLQNDKIMQAISIHLATGKYASPEDVVLTALQHLAEEEADYAAVLEDLRVSTADEEAGRMKPLATIVADVRRKHRFAHP